ncbi:hypothetical protein [Olleya sp. HaHaR_3_96]|uniref:hypothetical protein n=1 Tax=Olleya sp. HaHaR_3_96 TaxID=2745560 RepID=UPI001C4EE68D|nr:hypothetical protein [Olleya sp. HaHaR_3_96]QXP59749.1 hypothetical protein H0I26_17845 [Olleya sp. HaHaR_3_96]
MEKSIENIWENGFKNPEDLKVDKVFNYYEKKSNLLIEKLQRTYQLDNKSLLPMAVVLGLGLSVYGHIILGLYVMGLLITLFFYNKKILYLFEDIKISNSNYEYLVSYRSTIKRTIKSTTRVVGLIFPLLILPGYWLFYKNTAFYISVLDKFSGIQLIMMIFSAVIVFAFLFIFIYRVSTKVLYGNYMNQLDNMIKDLEALMSLK